MADGDAGLIVEVADRSWGVLQVGYTVELLGRRCWLGRRSRGGFEVALDAGVEFVGVDDVDEIGYRDATGDRAVPPKLVGEDG